MRSVYIDFAFGFEKQIFINSGVMPFLVVSMNIVVHFGIFYDGIERGKKWRS